MNVEELVVGGHHSEIVVSDLSRTQIVMYAGASGDFNPLHTDQVYASTTAGYDGVFAHGQLTLGLSAKAITGWLPRARLTRFGGRFLSQVRPGDTLVTELTVVDATSDANGSSAQLEFVTTNQDGVEVLSGSVAVVQGVS